MEKEFSDLTNRFEASIAVGQRKMRQFLMAMTKEERYRVLREDMAYKAIEAICEWALPEEDYV